MSVFTLLLVASMLRSASLPPLSDAGRFPSRETALAVRDFHAARWQHYSDEHGLNSRQWDTRGQILRVEGYAKSAWGLVAEAQCEAMTDDCRRRALRDLRVLIGEQAYYSGNLP